MIKLGSYIDKNCKYFSSQADRNGELAIWHCSLMKGQQDHEGNCGKYECPLGKKWTYKLAEFDVMIRFHNNIQTESCIISIVNDDAKYRMHISIGISGYWESDFQSSTGGFIRDGVTIETCEVNKIKNKIENYKKIDWVSDLLGM